MLRTTAPTASSVAWFGRPPNQALHVELEELVAVGLAPLEAITAATRTTARVLGASDEIGTIEEGKWADLVILNAEAIHLAQRKDRVAEECVPLSHPRRMIPL